MTVFHARYLHHFRTWQRIRNHYQSHSFLRRQTVAQSNQKRSASRLFAGRQNQAQIAVTRQTPRLATGRNTSGSEYVRCQRRRGISAIGVYLPRISAIGIHLPKGQSETRTPAAAAQRH